MSSVHLHKVIKSTPLKVYRAFLEPQALVQWMPPYGFTAEVHHLDAKEGGTYRMSFTNFGTGQTHSFGGTYRKLEPGSLLEYDDQFDDPHLPGQMSVSVRIQPVMCGVELTITQEGIPEMIPVEMCYLGWQESLKKLARLVEPEIPS